MALDVRLATVSDLFVAFQGDFESLFVLRRRLKALFDAGYLACPPQQKWREVAGRGNREKIYMLGNRGARLLQRIGVTIPRIDWDQRAKEWQPYSLDHPLLVTRMNVCLAQGIQQAAGLELVAFQAENKFVDFVTFFDGEQDLTLPIKPDGLFVVKDHYSGETLALFPEAERLTAPNRRRTFKQSSFYKKVLAYLHYYRHLDQLCERLAMPLDDFIVPVICETPERKEALRKRLYELGPTEQESSIFWVSDRTQLDVAHPTQLLFGEVWTTATGEQGSIFTRHPSHIELEGELSLSSKNPQ